MPLMIRKVTSQIIEEVISVVEKCDDYANKAGVFANLADEMKNNHRLSF